MQLRRGTKDQKLAWLSAHAWWGELDQADLARIAQYGDRVDLPADRLLMLDGERGIEAAMIIDGEVIVSKGSNVIAWLGPGEIVGELSILDNVPRNAQVRTGSDVELLVFHAASLRQALDEVEPLRQRVLERAASHRGEAAPQDG
jgi:CRP/FNR family transcriptional regulator, cyclic AMP receptor protein